MSLKKVCKSKIFSKGLGLTLFCAFVAGVAGHAVQAQSGRRSAPVRRESSSPSQPATPSTSETPASATTKKAETTKLNLVVTYYMEASQIQPEKALTVFDSFVRRLKDSTELNVTTEKAMNRKSAVVRASSEKETYVVWLRFQPDLRVQDRPEMGFNADNIITNYVVLAPLNARVKADGRIYCQCRPRSSTDINSGRSPKPARKKIAADMPVVYTLEETGREAANRVIEAFELHRPPER